MTLIISCAVSCYHSIHIVIAMLMRAPKEHAETQRFNDAATKYPQTTKGPS